MNQDTSHSLSQSLEKLRRLLGEDCVEGLDGSTSFVEDIANSVKRARDLIQTLRDAAQKAVQVFKARTAELWKAIAERQKSEALLAALRGVDHHAVLTRILYLLASLAFIRVPLFRYGPELSGFRHRFR